MILISKPYISDFLINTIKKHNLQIISTLEARNMVPDHSLNWISEVDAIKYLEQTPDIAIYTNSENSIGWIENNFGTSRIARQINLFKNKIKFRKLLADTFPDFFFRQIKFKNLRNLKIDEIEVPFIIKPAVGFFSIAVHKIDNHNEWDQVLDKIEKEIELLQDSYPKTVIDSTVFIIEEYKEGEEYAVDCYFNKSGEPVILNILHHIFSSQKDVSDRVYSTSQIIIERYFHKIKDFLRMIGEKTNLKNFPAHVEIRIDAHDNIFPIEVNPMRFGGWCTTGDLSFYSYGFNSYEYFLNNQEPDWYEIFKNRKGKKYSIIVLDNNSGLSGDEIKNFNYELLLCDFKQPLSLRKIDFTKYPVFGFLFIETKSENEKELDKILSSNLRKYIQIK